MAKRYGKAATRKRATVTADADLLDRARGCVMWMQTKGDHYHYSFVQLVEDALKREMTRLARIDRKLKNPSWESWEPLEGAGTQLRVGKAPGA